MEDKLFNECLEYYLNDGKEQGFWEQKAKESGYKNKNSIRRAFHLDRKKRGIPIKDANIEYQEKFELKGDGSVYIDKLIDLYEADKTDQSVILGKLGLNPEIFKLVRVEFTLWHGQKSWRHGGGLLLKYRCKAIADIREDELSQEDIENFFKTLDVPIYPKEQKRKQSGDFVLEICPGDLHIGTQGIYENEKTIEEKVEIVTQDILSEYENRQISKVILAPVGDITHFEGKSKQTARGTQMDSDGKSHAQVFSIACNCMIYMINNLLAIAPVEFLSVPGNHDTSTAFYLATALKFYYKKTPNVVIDNGELPRKYRLIGKSLVGWAHGDISIKNLKAWLHLEARDLWSESTQAEVHVGHFHKQKMLLDEETGTIVKFLSGLTPTNQWHYDKGFIGNIQQTQSFLWDLKTGLKGQWYSQV